VLACLEKQPEHRPQTAAELKQRLEACSIAPWNAESARAWWLDHQARLDRDAAPTAPTAELVQALQSVLIRPPSMT
jgi:hypothetical protein